MEGRGLYYPWSMTMDSDGHIYVPNRSVDGDIRGMRTTIMDIEENYYGTFGKFGEEPGENKWPNGIAIDSNDRLYTTDESLNRVDVRNLDGDLLDSWGVAGSDPGKLDGPSGIAINSRDELLIADHSKGVQIFSIDGKYLWSFGGPGSGEGQLNLPWGVFVNSSDEIYVADWGNNRVVKFSPEGNFIREYGSFGRAAGEFNAPASVCVDDEGYLYVADWGNQRIQVLGPDGNFIEENEGQATISKWAQDWLDVNVEEAQARLKSNLEPDIEFNTDDPHERSAHVERLFWCPSFVMIDHDRRLHVVDSNRHRVQVFDIN